MSSAQRLAEMTGTELARGFLWAPVCLGLGILAFFEVKVEPDFGVLCTALACALIAAGLALRASYFVRPLIWAAALIAFGFAVAGARTVSVAAPVLDWRYYGPVEGRVVGLDRSASGALRVTLDQVRLGLRPPRQTPQRVRLSIYGPDETRRPIAGSRIMTTAHLSPPSGPAEPHGFDFQRHGWFQKLGGVGYTRVPVLLAADPPGGFSFFALRLALSERIRSHLDGQTGAFAAALMTGDRSGLSEKTLRDLRHSNLAHLLAISGLHMGLLAAFVFAALRLALLPLSALVDGGRSKKLAALGALCAAAMYLGLSGATVATERAFIMAAVALGAIMLERRAISLRAVALAALIILLKRPEALMGPGFQMSFAATTALVVVFSGLGRHRFGRPSRSKLWGFVSGTVISSAVAGLATLPIAAAHFNLIAHYGLVANLSSVPLMGVMIIPLAVIAVCLMPLGWEGPVLQLMGLGLGWILGVAEQTSGWPHAITNIPAPPPWGLFALLFGLLLLGILKTHLRWVGLAPALVAVAGWLTVERPAVLISDTGVLVGVLTPEGRALSKERGAGFVASIWLENDGSASAQTEAFGLWQQSPAQLGAGKVIAASGKRGLRAFAGCAGGDIAVFSEVFDGATQCDIFDLARLKRTGSVALSLGATGTLDITTARAVTGRRYWNDRATRQRILPVQ